MYRKPVFLVIVIKEIGMNWKTYADRIEEKTINFKMNISSFGGNIYGFFKKRDIVQLFVLVEILNLSAILFTFFVILNLFTLTSLCVWPETNLFLIFSFVFIILLVVLMIVLSQIIRKKVDKIVNVIKNTNWNVLNEKELYELHLILTFLWINEILEPCFWDIQINLRKAMEKRYQSKNLSFEITQILEKRKHKTEEGSVIL